MSSNKNPNKVIIPCRFSYLHCWEPDSVNGSEPKYSVSAIIPKSDTATVNAIKAAIENAKRDSMSKWGGKIPPNLKLPLRDGDIDRPEDEAYASCYFLNANSRQAPQVVDARVAPITDQSEVYSGCYGKISVTFYGYEGLTARYETVSQRLNAIQDECAARKDKRSRIAAFMKELNQIGMPVTEFSEEMWIALVERVDVQRDGTAVFTFKNGSTVDMK